MMQRRKKYLNLLLIVLIAILSLVIVYSALRIVDNSLQKPAPEITSQHTKTIHRDGISYFPRQDITTILLMGIDEYGPVKSSDSYNNPGDADVVMILTLDETNQTYSILSFNRDTMVTMPVLGLGGKKVSTRFGQLTLSHTYGSGLQDSCENVKETVSDLLYGLNIDYYVSMNLDAIEILNDAVGGVKVTVTDDFSKVDDTIVMGEFTLNGKQAISYVQARKNIGDQLNTNRMNRQNEYMEGFMQAFRAKAENSESLSLDLYEQLTPYMVTDCTDTVLTTLVSKFTQYSLSEIITPEGSNQKGDVYMEFHLDEAKLDELILRMFYAIK